MKNIILAIAISLIAIPAFSGECQSDCCKSSTKLTTKTIPSRGLFRRLKARRLCRSCLLLNTEMCCGQKRCCDKNECCNRGCCSPEMRNKPVVCEKSSCPAGCSVDQCCKKCCGDKCCPSKKCKCMSCK